MLPYLAVHRHMLHVARAAPVSIDDGLWYVPVYTRPHTEVVEAGLYRAIWSDLHVSHLVVVGSVRSSGVLRLATSSCRRPLQVPRLKVETGVYEGRAIVVDGQEENGFVPHRIDKTCAPSVSMSHAPVISLEAAWYRLTSSCPPHSWSATASSRSELGPRSLGVQLKCGPEPCMTVQHKRMRRGVTGVTASLQVYSAPSGHNVPSVLGAVSACLSMTCELTFKCALLNEAASSPGQRSATYS